MKPVIALLAFCLRLVTSLLFATLRIKIEGKKELVQAAKSPLIVALWHDGLFLASLIRRVLKEKPLAIVVSNSKDGKLLAAYGKTFTNVEPIFVPHNSRHAALLQTVDAITSNKVVLITPDGPRGPRHAIKPGIFFAQEKADCQIIAMNWKATSYWELKSWDRLRIPKPFAKVTVSYTLSTKQDLAENL